MPHPEKPSAPTQPPPTETSAIRWGTAKPRGSTVPVSMSGELSDVILEDRR